MNRIILIAIAACIVIAGIRCSRQPVDMAGGSTSTNNARVTGMVYTENSQMVPGASVILRDIVMTPEGDSARTELSVTAGSSGDFAFDTVYPGNYVLEARNAETGEAVYKTRCEVRSDTAVSVSISKLYVLKGRICADSSASLPDFIVTVTGTVAPVHADGQGFYTISGIPAGQYDIAFILDNVVNYLPVQTLAFGSPAARADTVYVRDVYFTKYNTSPYSYFGTTLDAAFSVKPAVYAAGTEPAWYPGIDFSHVRYFAATGTQLHEISDLGLPTLLIDDFDDGDNVSLLNAITGKAYWYAYTDTLLHGNSIMLPIDILHAFSLGITDSAAFSGKSVSTTAILRHAYRSPYAGIALDLEPQSGTATDLSSMESLSFMLRGKGQIRVIFWSRIASTPYADSEWWGQFGCTELCTPAWKKVVIRPQDLAVPKGSKQFADSLKWQDAKTNIFRIEFSTWQNTSDTVGIALDQVYLNGVSESVFR
jgi:hypothetical protein